MLRKLLGENDKHGLRRTNADKRNAVRVMLEDEELQKLSDREIAEDCEVSHVLVWKMRKEQLVNINTSAELPTTETPRQNWAETICR